MHAGRYKEGHSVLRSLWNPGQFISSPLIPLYLVYLSRIGPAVKGGEG